MSEESIRNILASIQDINPNSNILEAGRIHHIDASEERIYVLLSVPAENVPQFHPIREQAETRLKELYPQKNILVGMTAVKNNPEPQNPPQKLSSPFPARRIVAVGSGKGGVGKSTVSLNLAVALANQHNLTVGLLDADIHGPSISHLMKNHKRPPIENKKIIPFNRWNIHAMSLGMLLEPEEPSVLRGPMMGRAVEQMLDDVAWPQLDILVIDFPPGTGDVHLSTARKIHIDGAIIVSTPQDLALLDARKMIAMCEKLNLPVIGCIENMAGFICPHCGEETSIFGKNGVQHHAKKLGLPYLGAIPLQMDIRTSSDEGQCLIVEDSQHPLSLAMARITDALVSSLNLSQTTS
jgi:ATP-binding protein involved in chromosome partitioning